MISFSGSLKIFLSVDCRDMRKGFNGLYGLVSSSFGEDPRSGERSTSFVTGDILGSRCFILMGRVCGAEQTAGKEYLQLAEAWSCR
jgi:hypothetical protein